MPSCSRYAQDAIFSELVKCRFRSCPTLPTNGPQAYLSRGLTSYYFECCETWYCDCVLNYCRCGGLVEDASKSIHAEQPAENDCGICQNSFETSGRYGFCRPCQYNICPACFESCTNFRQRYRNIPEASSNVLSSTLLERRDCDSQLDSQSNDSELEASASVPRLSPLDRQLNSSIIPPLVELATIRDILPRLVLDTIHLVVQRYGSFRNSSTLRNVLI